MFTSNEGISVQVSQSNVSLCGTILFQQNMANDGAGMFCFNSTVIFSSGSIVHFTNNSAANNGEAIYILYLSDGSSFLFGNNVEVTFENNSAVESGGAIFSEVDTIPIVAKTFRIVFDNDSGKSLRCVI